MASKGETVTLTNSFHGSAVRVRTGALSASTIRRVRRTLCGIDGCLCGGTLSERGRQVVEIIERAPGSITLESR